MKTMRFGIFAAALSCLAVAAAFLGDVFLGPLAAAVTFLVPDFAADPRDAVSLDAMAHAASTVRDDPNKSKVKAGAFLTRALRRHLYSAGGFVLDDQLSPA